MPVDDRARLIERITERLPLLDEVELTRIATRAECMTEPKHARTYGSAIAQDQATHGESPTGWALDVSRAGDTLPSGPRSEDWDSKKAQ